MEKAKRRIGFWVFDEVGFPLGGEAFGEECGAVGFGTSGLWSWGCDGAWGRDLSDVFC